MAVSQDVILRVLAQVADAVSGLNKVREEVRLLASEVRAASPFRLDIQIGEDLARLGELKAALESTLGVLKQSGSAAVKIDLSGIEAQLKELSARVKTGVGEIKTAFEGLSKVKVDLGLAKKAGVEVAQFQAEFKKLESQLQGSVNRLNTASRGVSFDPIGRSATLARDKVRIAAENMVEFLSRIPPGVQKDEAAFASLQAKIEGLRAAAQRLAAIEVVPPGGVPAAASLTSSIGALEKAFGLAAAAGQLFFASIVTNKLLDLGKSAVQVASDFQVLTGQLEIFEGGPEQAAASIDHLREVADSVGISFVTLAENFQKFLVPAQASGFTLQETQQIFDAISISVAGAGKSTEDVSGIFKTFTDVMQKGVIQSEELVKQFANHGIPATSLLAAAYGKTTAEIREMTKAHEVLSRDGIPALAAEMLKVYGPAALKNVESFRSENERFKNEVLDLKRAFGDELLPALVETLQALKAFKGEGVFGELGADVATLIRLLGDVARVVADLKNFNLVGILAGVDVLFLNIAAAGVRSFGEMEVAAANLAEAMRLAPEGFSEAVEKSVDAAVERLRFAAKEARKTGEEARRGADDAGKGVDDLSKNWEDLYKGLKKQQADHQQTAGKSEEEVTKKQLQELKKREDAYKGFFQTLADLASGTDSAPTVAAPQAVAGPDVKPGDSSALDQLKKDLAEALAAKRALSLQGITNPDDQVELDAVTEKIRGLDDQIARYGTTATTATQQVSTGLNQTATAATATGAAFTDQLGGKVVAALQQLILRSTEFATAFAELGPKAQAAITGIVGEFEKAARSGKITREEIEQFGRSLATAFQQGGLVSQQFGAQLAASFGTAEGATTSLVSVLQALADGSLRAVGSGADAAAGSVGKLGESAATSTADIDRLLVRTDAAAAGFIQAHGDSEQLKDGLFQVGLASSETSVKLHGVEIGLAKAAENSIRLHGEGGKLGENLLKVGESADKATAGAEKLAATLPPKNLAEGLDATAKAAEGVKAPLDAVATAAEKLGTAGQGEGVAKLGTALATASGPATALSAPLGQVAESAGRLAESVGKLVGEPGLGTVAAQLTPLLVPLQQLAEPATKLATALAELGRASQTIKAEGINALAESGAKLAAVVEPAGQAVAALTPVADVALTLGTNFGTLNTNAGNVATQLAAIGTAAAALVTALGDPALATGLDALGTSLAAAAPNLAVVANDVDRLGKSLEATKIAIPEVATGIDAIAKSVAAPEVKAGLGSLATAIEKIEKGATGAATGLKSIGESLGGISTSATKAASGLGELVKAIDVKKIQAGADSVGKLGSATATAATASANLADAAEAVRANVGLAIGKLDAAKTSVAALATEANKAGPVIRQQLAVSFATLDVQVAKVRADLDVVIKDLENIGTQGAGFLATAATEARGLATALREVASAAGAAKAGIAGVKFPTISGGR